MIDDIVKEEEIHKGAEASLFYGHWFGKEVIFKQRIPKSYRIPQIDMKIRKTRTMSEARALIKVKKYGINVPQVYDIDSDRATIIMKFIKGTKLRDILNDLDDATLLKYMKTLGFLIAKLHINGHVHGDITTSNILITENEDIFIIDFGLHEYSDTIEDKSVDLHLFKKVLISSHGDKAEICFNAFLDGYRSLYAHSAQKECNQIIKNIQIVETRGRYVKREDRS